MNMLLGARTAIAAAVDEFFNRVTLLLPGDGTNGAQNNTFLDSSTNNFTITRNGNTTQGTFSPFSQTGWSNYFDGSGDYLTASYSTTNFDWFTTGTDFTLEAWIFPTSFTGWHYTSGVQYPTLIGNSAFNSATNYWSFGPISDGTVRFIYYTGASPYVTSTQACVLNQWNHIALTKTSSGIAIFVNGVGTTATAISGTPQSSTGTALTIGAGNSAYINGYVSNLRIVKGTAIYSGTTYTVPTAPLTDVSNTKLLICQSNRFFDASSVANTITVNGNPSVQAFSPFLPTAAYSAATVGGSAYFDGTGDYLQSASSTTLQLGSSDFSIEWWEYRDVVGSDDTPVTTGDYAVAYGVMLLGYSGQAGFISTNGSSWNVLASPAYIDTLNAKSWNHFVYTRSGTAFRVFMNGKLSNYATGSGSVTQNNNQFNLGGNTGGGQYSFPGYIAGFRVVKGSIPTDYQTSSTTTGTVVFTPPAAPPTTTSQGATANDVELLLNMTNAAITDATAKNDLETVGNAQISTTQSKFGGSSMYFDGTGDYLTSYNVGGLFTLGTVYTVEMWFYTTTVGAGNAGLINFATTISGNAGFNLYRSSAEIICNDGATGGTGPSSGASSVSANTWTHLAVVSNGTTTKLYLDGVEKGSYTGTTGSANSMTYVTIGSFNDKGSPFSGYIDDLRVTRGYARYTANFTAPTAAFPVQ